MEPLLTRCVLHTHTHTYNKVSTVWCTSCWRREHRTRTRTRTHPYGQINSLSCDVELLCEKRRLQRRRDDTAINNQQPSSGPNPSINQNRTACDVNMRLRVQSDPVYFWQNSVCWIVSLLISCSWSSGTQNPDTNRTGDVVNRSALGTNGWTDWEEVLMFMFLRG